MLIEAPFVALAVLLPFAEGGERIDVAGYRFRSPGRTPPGAIVVKGALGVAAGRRWAAR